MAIQDFIEGAIREFALQNYHVAMACACTALDATAKADFGGTTRQRCINYIDCYLDVITKVGFGGAILSVPGSTLCVADPQDPTRTKDIKEIIYDAVRCSLIHEANLPYAVGFTDRAFFGMENGTFLIPTNFIAALIFAVVASSSNNNIKISQSLDLAFNGQPAHLMQIKGNAVTVRYFLGLP